MTVIPSGPGGAAASRRRRRWIAPVLAAAAVAAVAALAVGAVVLAAGQQPAPRPRPNPSATPVSSPLAGPSLPAGSILPAGSSVLVPPSASRSQARTVAAPAYLAAGLTGSRSEVPWSAVGPGWRLLVPVASGDGPFPETRLYLYDPAGGRYLISDRLPPVSMLMAWSPDGNRALLQTGNTDVYRYRELDLHTGVESAGFSVPNSEFVSYTQPRGLALIVQQPAGLVRYGRNGTVQHRYGTTVAGLGPLGTSAVFYLADGTQFVDQVGTGLALVGNDGQLVRRYLLPDGYQRCTPMRWWNAATILQNCERPGRQGPYDSLYLQPVTGGAPSLLTDSPGALGMGHRDAWRLSNRQVLLANASGCGSGGYQLLSTDGSIRPLQLPPGVSQPGTIVNIDGDLATFLQHEGGCSEPSHSRMIDYNLLTGRTSTLFLGQATVLSWPHDPQ